MNIEQLPTVIPMLAQRDLGPQELVFIIPIVGIVIGGAIAMWSMALNYRKRREFYELHHRERMAAIDKGVELPPLPEAFFLDGAGPKAPFHPSRYLLKGLIWFFIGIGIGVTLYAAEGREEALFGSVPVCIGLAYLIYYFAAARQEVPEQLRKFETKETPRG